MYNLRLEILKIYLSNNNAYINKDRFKRNNKYLIHLFFIFHYNKRAENLFDCTETLFVFYFIKTKKLLKKKQYFDIYFIQRQTKSILLR
jgi:hypothetical protein